MGKVADFSTLPYKQAAAGVQRAPITGSEMKQMAGEIIKLAPGASISESVPQGSDHYFYTLTGEAGIAADGQEHHMVQDSFAAVQEGKRYTVTNAGNSETTLVSVLAPPPGSGVAAAGFNGGLAVAARATQPVVDIADQKKQRIYFVGKEAAKSERSHAMIVVYVRDTVTGMHMHPNAESMFVLLTGKTRFTVNNEDVVVQRGQATIFPMGDRHGLRVAEGEGVSFLEFHLPAAYTTVKG
jgi:mannose-6-phosphate isomerase-like protein (cupin superfamily)